MRKTPKEVIDKLCEEKNWTLLDEYKNSWTPMRWRCNQCNLTWTTCFSNAKNKKGCCFGGTPPKVSIETVEQLCKEKDWKLIGEFKNVNESTKWGCLRCGSTWETSFTNLKIKMGCCHGGNTFYDEEAVQKIANEHGVKLLVPYTVSNDSSLTWECLKCKAQFNNCFSNILRDEREVSCTRCTGIVTPYNLDDVHKICSEKNLTCLSDEYKHSNTPMLFKCNRCSREWSTSFRSIVQNIGCIKCTFETTMCLNLDIIKERLKDRPMELVSTTYVNSQTKLEWKCTVCEKNWHATYSHIQHSQSGCPNCASYRSQKLCRQIFEELFNKPFPTKRPKFLKGLEYDGYNEALNLAFEYQGIQHYEFTEYFHRTEDALEKLQENDKLKLQLSKDNNITLIIIPYTFSYLNEEELRDFICSELLQSQHNPFHTQ